MFFAILSAEHCEKGVNTGSNTYYLRSTLILLYLYIKPQIVLKFANTLHSKMMKSY